MIMTCRENMSLSRALPHWIPDAYHYQTQHKATKINPTSFLDLHWSLEGYQLATFVSFFFGFSFTLAVITVSILYKISDSS